METRSANPSTRDHDAAEFVRFCYRRRRVGWPELYDEMCGVAARGLFRGMNADDLAGLGIGFSLFDMPALAALSNTIVAEEHAKRRPVAVAIFVEEPVQDVAAVEARGTASFEHARPAKPLIAGVEPELAAATPIVTASPVEVDVTAHMQSPVVVPGVAVEPDVPGRSDRGPAAPVRLVGVAAHA
jgi:hypothetical protein